MYITKTVAGKQVALIVRYATEERLATTCFRGKTKNLAGNFFRWENVGELFREQIVIDAFLKEIETALTDDSLSNSVCIEFGAPIGWTGTDHVQKYHHECLEKFTPNRKSYALRVKTDRSDLAAPRTSLLTIVYEIRPEEDQTCIIIHSIYPGKDIGELKGDITARESCVFFDWNHPGVKC
jgi:hypothetical protein